MASPTQWTEFEQTLGDGEGKDRGAWCAAVHGVAQSFSNNLTTKQQKVNEDSNDTTSKNI